MSEFHWLVEENGEKLKENEIMSSTSKLFKLNPKSSVLYFDELRILVSFSEIGVMNSWKFQEGNLKPSMKVEENGCSYAIAFSDNEFVGLSKDGNLRSYSVDNNGLISCDGKICKIENVSGIIMRKTDNDSLITIHSDNKIRFIDKTSKKVVSDGSLFHNDPRNDVSSIKNAIPSKTKGNFVYLLVGCEGNAYATSIILYDFKKHETIKEFGIPNSLKCTSMEVFKSRDEDRIILISQDFQIYGAFHEEKIPVFYKYCGGIESATTSLCSSYVYPEERLIMLVGENSEIQIFRFQEIFGEEKKPFFEFIGTAKLLSQKENEKNTNYVISSFHNKISDESLESNLYLLSHSDSSIQMTTVSLECNEEKEKVVKRLRQFYKNDLTRLVFSDYVWGNKEVYNMGDIKKTLDAEVREQALSQVFFELNDKQLQKNDFKANVENYVRLSLFQLYDGVDKNLYGGESALIPRYSTDGEVEEEEEEVEGEDVEVARKLDGEGIVFVPVYGKKKKSNAPEFQVRLIGNFQLGTKEGHVMIFSTDGSKKGSSSTSKHKLIFRGEFRAGKEHGRCIEYEYFKDSSSKEEVRSVFYEGLYSMGSRKGMGEEFHQKTGKVRRGIWDGQEFVREDKKDPSPPEVTYQEISEHLTEENQITGGKTHIGWSNYYRIPLSAVEGNLKSEEVYSKDGFVVVRLVQEKRNFAKRMYDRMISRGSTLCRSIDSDYIMKPLAILTGPSHFGYFVNEYGVNVQKLMQMHNKGEQVLTMERKIRIIYETAQAILALHENGIVHRILMWKYVMIGKYDNAVKLHHYHGVKKDERLWRLNPMEDTKDIGVEGFFPPESFLNGITDQSGDIFTFGLLMYGILMDFNQPLVSQYQCRCGVPIKILAKERKFDHHIANCDLRPLITRKMLELVPEYFLDMMILCWKKDRSKRPTAKQIVDLIRKNEGYDIDIELTFPTSPILPNQKISLKKVQLSAIRKYIEGKAFISDEPQALKKIGGDDEEIIQTNEDLKEVIRTSPTTDGSVKIEVELSQEDERRLNNLRLEIEKFENEVSRNRFFQYLTDENTQVISKERTKKEINDLMSVCLNDLKKEYKKMHLGDLRYEIFSSLINERMEKFFSYFCLKDRFPTVDHLYYGLNYQNLGEAGGFGVIFRRKEYLFKRDSYYIPEIFGEFNKDGKLEGLGWTVDPRSKKLSCEGTFEDGMKNGKCLEFEYFDGIKENVVVFEGRFRNGKRHGRGEMFDPRLRLFTHGIWENGSLNEKTVHSFNLLEIRTNEFIRHMNESSKIGEGGWGTVYKIKRSQIPSLKNYTSGKIDKFVAVKTIRAETRYLRDLTSRIIKRGVGLISLVDSEHVLDVYAVFKGNNYVGYVMELCDLSIDRLLIPSESRSYQEKYKLELNIEFKKKVLLEVAQCMLKFHERNVMHRDLKLGNVMLKNGVVKLTDFDTMKEDERNFRIQAVQQSSSIGTPGFIAPEVHVGKDYTTACDVYAYGLMIYCLLFETNNPYISQYSCSCGKKIDWLFAQSKLDDHCHKHHLRPLLDPKEIGKHPSYLVDLMVQCWDKNPFNRPSFQEIVMRFKIEKNKSVATVNLSFPTHKIVDNQKVFLIKPYERSKIVEWIETKFKGSKVLKLEGRATGTIQNDEDLCKLIEKFENPCIEVRLDEIDENLVFFEEDREISFSDYKKLEELNLKHVEEIGRLKEENFVMEKRKKEYERKMEEMEKKLKIRDEENRNLKIKLQNLQKKIEGKEEEDEGEIWENF